MLVLRHVINNYRYGMDACLSMSQYLELHDAGEMWGNGIGNHI